ncbi:MAG TPA: hypothetical protein VIE67_09805 [Rudaea sp.]|jgi:TolB-like protein|uniref:tetratricopeptide repeat protein n=1 Tax=Rudaea sp. TaxID=2136325 RepID=UPI002F95D9C7
MNDFLQRLRERKLVQWALAYAAAAFALLQGFDIVAQRFAWPEAIERMLILALAIGFFVAIVLAWYHGEKGAQRVGGVELSILALLLAIGGGLLWRFAAAPVEQHVATTSETAESKPASTQDPRQRNSIAVLPFSDMSPGHDQEYFSDGMTEEILNALAQVQGLKVAGRTSSFFYKGKNENLQVIGRTLGVAHILEGSVRKQGDRVRITAQLIQAADDSHLWSKEYDGTLNDIFELQERIARAITDQLKLVLQDEQKPHGALHAPKPEAYQQYLRGQYFWHQRGYENLQTAIAAYQAALVVDPDYADAWAGMAQVYAILPEYYETVAANTGAAPDTMQQALDAADHALRLEPASSAALLARAYIRGARQFDWSGAEADFRAVVAANPQDATAHQWYGEILMYQRRWTDCDAQFDALLAIDPLSVIAQHLKGFALALQGRFEEALPVFDEALRIAPAFVFSQNWKVFTQVKLHRYDEAQAAISNFPEPRRELMTKFVTAARDPAQRDRLAEQIAAGPAQDTAIQMVLAIVGRDDLALAAIERQFHDKAPFRGLVYANVLFDPLQKDPRFQALLRQVNLPPASGQSPSRH